MLTFENSSVQGAGAITEKLTVCSPKLIGRITNASISNQTFNANIWFQRVEPALPAGAPPAGHP